MRRTRKREATVTVEDCHEIVPVLDQRAEPALGHLRFDLLGDVDRRPDVPSERAVRVVAGNAGVDHPAIGAVRGLDSVVDLGSLGLRGPQLECLGDATAVVVYEGAVVVGSNKQSFPVGDGSSDARA